MSSSTIALHTVRSDRRLLICLSHLRWDFVYQRPQHLLTRASLHWDVLFVEEPVVEAVDEPTLRLIDALPGLQRAIPVLPPHLDALQAARAQRELIDRYIDRAGRSPELLWYYTPMALSFTRHLQADLRIYDNMDELSAFRGAPQSLLTLEDELFRRCDLVFTGGHSLYEAKRDRHADLHAFPSSVDTAHFGRARRGAVDPADQAGLDHPRLGYFGVIDERLDLPLVDAAAQAMPQWQFVMVGPVAKIDPSSLPRRPNLHWLGAKRYEDLPAYLANWDVGIMPFALNEATRYISPTKTPEFLAAGVPVVSTPIRDVVQPYGEAGLVAIASGADGFVAAARTLMALAREPWLDAVDRQLALSSWDSTWNAMHRLIADRLARKTVDRAASAGRPLREATSALAS